MKASSQAPPLAKGLACQRCSARKVRCTGGKPACAACLRTAKFKNHPLDQVCCAYGAGLCSEHTPEKGPGGHGGRGRKKDPITGMIITAPPKQQTERRGLGQRSNTADSSSSSSTLPSALPSSLPTSAEPAFAFESAVNSPAFTPATSIGSISPGTAQKQLDSSIAAALALPVPPPHPQPVLPARGKVPLAARRLGFAPMKIAMPGSSFPPTAGSSLNGNGNGKRPAAQQEDLVEQRFGSIAERRRSAAAGQAVPEMVLPLAKRSRSGSPRLDSPVESISGYSHTESAHEPALSASGSTSNGSLMSDSVILAKYADSPVADELNQASSTTSARQPQHALPTPDPYPSSYNHNFQYTDAYSSFPTPYLTLMTNGGRLTGGAGVGTPFWYGEKRRIGATEINFGDDSTHAQPKSQPQHPTEAATASVGGREVTW